MKHVQVDAERDYMDSVSRHSICLDDLEFGRSRTGHDVIGASDRILGRWRNAIHESGRMIFVEIWSTPVDLVDDHDDRTLDVWIAIVTIHDPYVGSQVTDDHICQLPKSRQRFGPHSAVAGVARKLVHPGRNADPQIVSRRWDLAKMPRHLCSPLLGMRTHATARYLQSDRATSGLSLRDTSRHRAVRRSRAGSSGGRAIPARGGRPRCGDRRGPLWSRRIGSCGVAVGSARGIFAGGTGKAYQSAIPP